MRQIALLFCFCFFVLPQVRAQLHIPELENSWSLTTISVPDLPSVIAEPLSLSRAMLYPESGSAVHLQSAINNRSLLYRPHLAFFCRVEVELEKAASMPIRFRLGSVDYVDYLEGKRSQ